MPGLAASEPARIVIPASCIKRVLLRATSKSKPWMSVVEKPALSCALALALRYGATRGISAKVAPNFLLLIDAITAKVGMTNTFDSCARDKNSWLTALSAN